MDLATPALFSSPYHHQTNSLAERSVGICKPLWRKATEDQRNLDTALWMHRITPLDDHLPSPYELLFGCKSRTLLPNSKNALLSKHPDNDYHQEANQLRQRKQADHYNYKAGSDRRILQNMEPVYVRNTKAHMGTSCSAEQTEPLQRAKDIPSRHARNNLPEDKGTFEAKKHSFSST